MTRLTISPNYSAVLTSEPGFVYLKHVMCSDVKRCSHQPHSEKVIKTVGALNASQVIVHINMQLQRRCFCYTCCLDTSACINKWAHSSLRDPQRCAKQMWHQCDALSEHGVKLSVPVLLQESKKLCRDYLCT